jgi:hypothetical protein
MTVEKILRLIEARNRKQAKRMPDEQAALRQMFDAYDRLIKLGWSDAIYCPKDGTTFDAIEAGSTGIHDCYYSGPWPKGSWWIVEAEDHWPCRPVLFRLKPGQAATTQAEEDRW